MNKISKILIASAAGYAAVKGARYALTRVFFDSAVYAEKPKYLEKLTHMISGANLDEKINSEVNAKSDELRASEKYREVEIRSYDGLKLRGHYYRHPEAKRIIIAFHGWRSCWSRDFSIVSDFWKKNGCSILYCDQRGHGDSEGKYIGFGLTERYDCLAWAKYLSVNTHDIPIYLAGLSMGGTTVLMASDLELPERVAGIMSDCAFSGPQAEWKHIIEKNFKFSYEIIRDLADKMLKKKLGVESVTFTTSDALKNAKVPVLFIHGASDNFVPVTMTYENYLACASEKMLLIVPGADHGISYRVEKDNYERKVLDFISLCENKAEE